MLINNAVTTPQNYKISPKIRQTTQPIRIIILISRINSINPISRIILIILIRFIRLIRIIRVYEPGAPLRRGELCPHRHGADRLPPLVAGRAMSMLEQRSYVVGTCHGMSPEAVPTWGIESADMPWHVPAATGASLSQWHCLTARRSLWVARTGWRRSSSRWPRRGRPQKRRPRGAVGLSGDAWRGR